MIAEDAAVRWGRKRRLAINVWLARVLTVSFMMWLGHLLFFAACNTDTDTAARVIAACQGYFQPMTDAVMKLFQ